MTCLSIVIPAKAGIQLHRSKLDPDFRQGDEKKEIENFPLDKIPNCVYMVSICSVKEAVIRKPHLFKLIRGAAAVCPRVPEAPWQVRMAVGALSGLRILAPQLGGARPTQLIFRN